MGRTEKLDLTGIEIREKSIRIRFKHQGKVRKETVCVDNVPLPPTASNIKYATRQLKDINKAILNDDFNYADYFPHSLHIEDQEEGVSMLFDVIDKSIDLFDGKSSTKRQYQKRLNNFWKKTLKNQPIVKVSYSDILTALKLGTWKSGKSRNNEISLIRGVFEYARKDNLIKKNPCDEIKRAGYQKPPPDPFELQEVHVILAHLERHRPEQIWNFVQMMFFTGLRTSEGLALRWGDIDFKKREAMIDGANVYDEETDETKTYESRVIKLNAMAMEALQRQKAHTLLANEHVFHDPKTGNPWLYRQITDVRTFWKATLVKTGIRYRRPYNMRHTYASVGLMSGVTPAFMAAQLGHSLRTFFQDYAKWINSTQNKWEMEKIEAAIAKNSLEIPQGQRWG
jgi:integrase